MAIVNRDHDASEQRDWLSWSAGLPVQGATFTIANGSGYVPTGTTLFMFGPMPYPYVLQSIIAVTNGASGAPQLAPFVIRPLVGGATMLLFGISNMVVANSASLSTASLSYSGLAATGSTLLLGQRGDMICASTAVANTACTQLMVQAVVKRVQDVVTLNGI